MRRYPLRLFGTAVILVAIFSSCVTPRAGLYRPARIDRMTVDTMQGSMYWDPVSLSLEESIDTAVVSFYDYSSLVLGRFGYRARGRWIPYHTDGTVYRNGNLVMLPFISQQRYVPRTVNFGYGITLDVPDRTYFDAEYAVIRLTDGAFDPRIDGTPRTIADPMIPRDFATRTSQLFIHPGIEDLPQPPRMASRIDTEVREMGFEQTRFRTVHQNRNTWEGVDVANSLWFGWRRRQERIEILLFRFETPDDLLAVMSVHTDVLGFGLEDPSNEAGWYASGIHVDGRSFDGIINARGREGYGTTVFPDGLSRTGTYENDLLEGFAITLDRGRVTDIGVWRGGQRHGVHLRFNDTADADEVQIWENGTQVSSEPYVPGPVSDEWLWLGNDSQPIAVSRDFSDRIIRYVAHENGQEYTIEARDGEIINVIDTADGTRGIIQRNDGWVYEGPLVNNVPHGEGVLISATQGEIRGTFENGVLQGARLPVESQRDERSSIEALYTGLEQNTRTLMSRIESIRTQVARMQAADRAARMYSLVDTLQRDLADMSASNEVAAALDDFFTETGLLDSLSDSLLEQAQGSAVLAQYQFERMIERAIIEQDFRELRSVIVASLSEDERYAGFAQFLDVAGEIVQTGWDAARAQRAANADVRSAAASQEGARRAQVAPRPPWPNGPRPSFDENSVHLRAIVLTADEHYRGYVTLLERGEPDEAERYYAAHLTATQNAYDFVELSTRE